MSTLSRFPQRFERPRGRNPLGDRTNDDDTEAVFFNESRKALKKATLPKPANPCTSSKPPKSSRPLTLPSPILTTNHPGVARIIQESDIRSPPLSSILSLHERKLRRSASPKRRNLVALGVVSGMSRSSSSSDLLEDGELEREGAFKLDQEVEEEKKEEDFVALGEDAALDANAIFEKLSRIEVELENEISKTNDDDVTSSNDNQNSDVSIVARAIVENAIETTAATLPSNAATTLLEPLAPPSSEMRKYAYSLLASPTPRAISPSPMGLPKSTPTPVKITMDADSVLTGSPVEDAMNTSPLGKGVDKILVEGVDSPGVYSDKEGATKNVWIILPVLIACWGIFLSAIPTLIFPTKPQ